MKRILWLCLFLSLPVQADWYVGYGVGSVTVPLHVTVPPSWERYGFYADVKDSSRTFNGLLGYRFDRLSLEAAYHDLGDYSACLKNRYLDAYASGGQICAYATLRSLSLGANYRVAGPFFVGFEAHRAQAKGSLVTELSERRGWVPSANAGIRVPLGEHSRLRLQANSYPVKGWFLGAEYDLR